MLSNYELFWSLILSNAKNVALSSYAANGNITILFYFKENSCNIANL